MEQISQSVNPDACYAAMLAHDARFDGVFFVGVKTTGVYCRPVCRARTPRKDRCVFFTRAAQAEKEGFRACFRCRPERAPGSSGSSTDAVSQLVVSAMRKIDEGALNDRSVDDLAKELGVGARHLRRVMQDELGVGPLELAQSKRIALARELLLGTSLPITDVAFASGFSSVRRFNDAYRANQNMTPTEVRRPSPQSEATASGLRVVLDVRPPFDPEAAFSFLRARSVANMDVIEGDNTYRRATSIQGKTGIVSITPAAKARSAIIVDVSSSLAPVLMTITARVRRMFDTDADPQRISEHLGKDPVLRKRVRARPALRVMGAFDPFEWATRAVLGQQVSVRAALTIAARLVDKFGTPIEHERLRAWPTAEKLAGLSEDKIASIGLTGARAKTLRGLAKAVADGTLSLDHNGDFEATRASLLALPGIGPWTAEYIMMRAMGWPDAFPSGDLGLRKALGENVSAAVCEERSKAWRPWRAYAAAHLWTGLSEETGKK